MSNIGLNPYEFLGLTPNSSLDELKKSYHELALLIHPDKGGSSEEMHILNTAYIWIKSQLVFVDSRLHKDYESIQIEFDEFIKKQDNIKPPPLTNILAELIGFEYTKFSELYDITLDQYRNISKSNLNYMINNKKFMYSFIYFGIHSRFMKNNKISVSNEELWDYVKSELKYYCTSNSPLDYDTIIPAAIQHGYENDMDPSLQKQIDLSCLDLIKETRDVIYESIQKDMKDMKNTCINILKQEVIKYIEPRALTEYNDFGSNINKLPEMLSNYTLNEPIAMTDYKEAFSDISAVNTDLEKLVENLNLSTPIENLIKERTEERKHIYD
jgi:hypothetical protein